MFPLLLVLGTAPGAGPDQLLIPVPPPPLPQGAPAAPTWDRMFPPSGYCAGPELQPFHKQPRVCAVKVCECDSGEKGEKSHRAWVKEFHEPAQVAYPRFDIDGRRVPGDGLLIYEGMRFAVDPVTGKYDLTFTATVPAMPVTLRLQLVFAEDKGTEVFDPDTKRIVKKPGRRYTLTLPPIRMQPPRDAIAGDPTPNTFHIAHRGYSSLFLDPKRGTDDGRLYSADCPPQGPIDCTWTVSRVGTARFGTPVAVDDPNR